MSYELHMCYTADTFFVSGTGTPEELAALEAEAAELLSHAPAKVAPSAPLDELAYMRALALENSPECAQGAAEAKTPKRTKKPAEPVFDPVAAALS